MTGLTIDLSAQRLFEPRQQLPGVDGLLSDCFARQAALALRLVDGSVQLSTAQPATAAITLTGRWRSPALASSPQGAGALLLLPFLFEVHSLVLPPGSLYTLGRGDRPLADLFLRNYFYAACRGEPVRVVQAGAALPDAAEKCSRQLARNYLWLMRSQVPEPVFSRPNAAELILANAHLALFEHVSALLDQGADEWRQAAGQAAGDLAGGDSRLQAFRQSRAKMLTAYQG